jgi:sugar phosphate isomerase/epimerase
MLTCDDYSISLAQLRGVRLHDALPALAEAGFRGFVLSRDVYQAERDAGLSDGDIRRLIADHGMEIEYLDGMICWLPGAPLPALPPGVTMVADPTAFFEAAAAIGAPMVNAVEIFGHDPGHAAMVDGFAGICQAALSFGLKICLEFTPLGSIPDLASAKRVLVGAGADNGGVLFDTWHFARSGGMPDDIATLPKERFFALQVSDTDRKPHDNAFDEALHHRVLPGQGSGNLLETLQACASHGVRRPLSAEVLSDALAALPVPERLRLTMAAVKSVSPFA